MNGIRHGRSRWPLVLGLVWGLSATCTIAAGGPNRWADDTYGPYSGAIFGPIDGTYSWGLVTTARHHACLADSATMDLLASIDHDFPDPSQTWQAIAIITDRAAALTAAEIDYSGLSPQAWRRKFPQQARYALHSGHWWDYWNRLAQLGRWAFSDPTLAETLSPQILRVLTEMEQAFLPYLVVAPEMGSATRTIRADSLGSRH